MALQLGLSLLGFVYQDKQGPISNSDTTQCVDSRRVFVCSLLHPVEYQEEGRRHTTPSDFCYPCLVRLALARLNVQENWLSVQKSFRRSEWP